MEAQIDALTNVLRTCARAIHKIGRAGAAMPELLDGARGQIDEAVLILEQRKVQSRSVGQHDDGHVDGSGG